MQCASRGPDVNPAGVAEKSAMRLDPSAVDAREPEGLVRDIDRPLRSSMTRTATQVANKNGPVDLVQS
ncbi:hypothetical protein VHEMI05856 [[Torrubiella] hemipterigena]|uniref:Uncharacterized protein n=1 Tax=[Torrubiella] hemipterigena TaxID=1531966 RepID=A0A0A1TJS1_9HYPO|nr:hypothetical protein VHEMI05856 [[Torrubiella] hemipterigena]